MMIASTTLPRKDALRKHGRSPDMVARAELEIRYNGRNYVYRGYHYARLADAVSYARLDRARSSEDDLMAAASAPFKAMGSEHRRDGFKGTLPDLCPKDHG